MDGEDLGLLDGTGEAAGGDEGGSGGEETFILPEGADDGAAAGADGGDAAAGAEDDQAGADGADRSRAIVKFSPTEVKKGLRELVSQNPEFAKKFPTLEKAVATALFKDARVAQLGGLEKINQLAEAVEVHGGIDGIQEMAEELTISRELEHGFEIGDPKVIDGWATDYPAGFKKLIVPALNKLEKLDDEHFDAVASYITNKIFERTGAYSAIAAIGEALQAQKPEDAVKHFNGLAKLIGTMKTLATKATSGRTDRDAELDDREKSIAERDKTAFYGSVRQDVNTQVMSEMNRLIRLSLPAGKQIRVEQANRLRKEINAELMRVVTTKAGYADRYESVMNARNKDRAVRFIVQNVKAVMPAVVKQLLREFNLMGAAAGAGGRGNLQRRAANGGSGGSGGSGTVSGRPKIPDVDFTRTDKAVFIASREHGTAWLKSGKQAKW